jgi:hypothetical protein
MDIIQEQLIVPVIWTMDDAPFIKKYMKSEYVFIR